MKQLENFFNIDDNQSDDEDDFDYEKTLTVDDDDKINIADRNKNEDITLYDFADLNEVLSEVDKIDQALGPVKGLEVLDSEMDALANRAMEVFEILVGIGQNVEDKNIAPVFDAASKMLGGAISARQSKMDRKLKAIQLQLQKARLDQDQQKFDWKVNEKRNNGDAARPIDGSSERISISRTELLRQILSEKDK